MEAIKQRIGYIDILKGIGISFVVFGHVTHIDVMREYIWDFHMPLFFWISGMLFNRDKYAGFRSFVAHKVNTIVLPYILFFLITFLYFAFIERHFRGGEFSIPHQLLGLIYGTYEGFHLNFNGALWFLPCLFSVELMFWAISKCKDSWGVAGLLLICFVLATLIRANNLNILPWGIHTALFAVTFYGIGFFSKEHVQQLSTRSGLTAKIFLLIGCFGVQLLCIGKYSSNIGNTTLPYIPLALCGIAVYLIISIFIRSNRLLAFLGKNSIVILAFQEQTYRALIYVVSKMLSIDTEVIRTNIFYCLVITVFTLAVIYPLIYLYNKFARKYLNVFK